MKKCLILLAIPLLLARPVYAMDGWMDGGGFWDKFRTITMCIGCCCETCDSCLKYGFNVRQAIRTHRAQLIAEEVKANNDRYAIASKAKNNEEEKRFLDAIDAKQNLEDINILKNFYNDKKHK